MSNEQILKLLRSIPLFSELKDDELMVILRTAKPMEFGSGDLICREGDPGNGMYVIQSGEAKVTIRGRDGQAIPVATLKTGDLLGEMNLVDNDPRSATVMATSSVRCFFLDRGRFDQLRAELHPAAFKVMRRITLTVCGRLRRVNDGVSRYLGKAPVPKPAGRRVQGGAVQTRQEDAEEGHSFWSGLMGRIRGG